MKQIHFFFKDFGFFIYSGAVIAMGVHLGQTTSGVTYLAQLGFTLAALSFAKTSGLFDFRKKDIKFSKLVFSLYRVGSLVSSYQNEKTERIDYQYDLIKEIDTSEKLIEEFESELTLLEYLRSSKFFSFRVSPKISVLSCHDSCCRKQTNVLIEQAH